MNQPLHRLLFAAITSTVVHTAVAQHRHLPFSAWAFPGFSWQQNPSLRFVAQYGYNSQWKMNSVYLQGFIKVSKHITLNPAYLYLQRNTPYLEEHTFMPAIIASFPLGRFILDDRNVYWYRIRLKAEDTHYYRNRFRIAWPLTTGDIAFKPYLYFEAFYLFNRGRWTRNRLAPGFSLDVLHRFNLDVSFNRELDYFNGRSNLVFIMSSFQLNRFTHTTTERHNQKHRMQQ